VRAIIPNNIDDFGGISRRPVGKVEGDEHGEVKLLGGLVRIGELLRSIAVDSLWSAV
jgi:hypothetical protein